MVQIIENTDTPLSPSHHTAFEIDDIAAVRDELQSIGVECADIQTRHDGQQAFYFHDLDHNSLDIGTRSGFGVPV